MKRYIHNPFFFLIGLVWLLLNGCKTTEEVITPYLMGWINNWGGSHSEVKVYITGIPDIPTVKINDINLTFIGFYNGELAFGSDTFPISPGDSVDLRITFTDSNGNPARMKTNLILPDTVEIIQIQDTLSINDSLLIIWRPAYGAREYNITLNISLVYHDTSGALHFFYESKSFWLEDSLITLLPDTLFPIRGEVSEILPGSYMRFSLFAYSGSYKEGDQANVKGDGFGFFYTRTTEDIVYITVVSP